MRFVALTIATGVLLAGIVALQSSAVQADDKAPSIEQVMKKLHGKNGSHKVINKALDGGSPDWDTVSKHAKIYADLCANLDKAKPEKGETKSWETLAKAYAKDAKALSDAAGKKDKDAAKAAFAKLKESCDACHENHR